MRVIQPPPPDELCYDIKNPKLLNYIRTRAAGRIEDIDEKTRQVVRDVVMKAFSSAMVPRQMAKEIVDYLELLPSQEVELLNYSNGLRKGTTVKAHAACAKKVETFRKRLLMDRAMTHCTCREKHGELFVWTEAASRN